MGDTMNKTFLKTCIIVIQKNILLHSRGYLFRVKKNKTRCDVSNITKGFENGVISGAI